MQPSSPVLKVKKFKNVGSADFLEKPGDFYIVENLNSAGNTQRTYKAIIFKCPFCGLDNSSTRVHEIWEDKSFFDRIFRRKGNVTVTPDLECRYMHTHRFNIFRGKIIDISNGGKA